MNLGLIATSLTKDFRGFPQTIQANIRTAVKYAAAASFRIIFNLYSLSSTQSILFCVLMQR
jgi:hypothetical protein